MKLNWMAWLVGFWCAFFAAGTWILPTERLLGLQGVASAASRVVDDEAWASAEAAEIIDALASGGLDPAAHLCDSIDVDGDEVPDPILTQPSGALGQGGRITVLRGSNASLLIDVCPVAGESAFAFRIGVVEGIETGGVKTLLVASAQRDSSGADVGWIFLRAFSGCTGSLLGVAREWVSAEVAATGAGLICRAWKRAGDQDGDGTIEVRDVLTVIAHLQPFEGTVESDVTCDGVVTVLDVTETTALIGGPDTCEQEVLERLGSIEAVTELHANASNGYSVVHHWSSWKCWGVALLIAAELVGLLAGIALCGAVSATPSPAIILCLLAVLCGLIHILTSIFDHQLHCNVGVPQGEDLEPVEEVIETIQLLTGICTALAGGIAAVRELVERGGGVKVLLERLLRGYGLQ